MPKSEAQIVDSIMRWLRKQPDCYAWKTVGTMFGRRGIPDICGNVGDRMLYLEAKTAIGKVSPRQHHEHDLIRKAGGEVFIVRSLEDAQAAVEQLRKN